MGLSGRKEKQRIGEDPRNTKWAKNESNPGYKLLSSMGWTPSQASLGLASTSSEPVRSSWKRLPTALLPVLKSTTTGLGAHPAQSSSYVAGAPRFVPSSQSAPPCALGRKEPESTVKIEDDKARASKLALVANGLKGGGFDDLLGRLNRQKAVPLPVDASQDESFVLVVREPGSEAADKNPESPKKKKRVRIADECCVKEPQKKKHRTDEEAKSEKRRSKRDKEEKKKRKSTKVKPTAGPSNSPGSKAETSEDDMVATSAGPLRISRPMNPRMAARAKFIRSKKLASTQNSVAMAEILGIPPS